jgi:predicted nucleotide-binding protein
VPATSAKRVFVVHGHDHALKSDLEVFLHEVGLEPVVLHRKADEGLTIIEKFERYSDVSFAFVLLTPDDIAYVASEADLEPDKRAIELRARQNVVFEFGYFAAKLGRANVCCIYKAGVTLPTDISGLLYKQVTSSIDEIGYALIKELKHAGLRPTV